jgi:hypothetical protein
VQAEVPPLDTARRPDLDQATGTARVVARLAVAEARLVEMEDRDRQG